MSDLLARITAVFTDGDAFPALLEELTVAAAHDPGDSFHSMAQLYEQRALYHALYVNLAVALGTTHDTGGGNGFGVTKSWRHHDGQPCFGITEEGKRWFIVTMFLTDGRQVSQHYPQDLWDAFRCTSRDTAPMWDGHTAEEGNARMRRVLGLPA